MDDTLSAVTEAARLAGHRLLSLFDPASRPMARAEMFATGRRNEEASLAVLRPALEQLRPAAGWVEGIHETTLLPPGEWWAVDAVEGNVNHLHGGSEWCVSVTLIRENVPVLAVVHQPIGDLTWTAVLGGGAFVNGVALKVSRKTALADAIVATGQAEADQRNTYRRIGDSITLMLARTLFVRVGVPSTFPMLLIAAGQNDAFWQYEPVLPGIAAGLLLVTEAGGVASRLDGSPWSPGSADLLVSAPGIHAAMLEALGEVK